jgi:hypothetical protein
MKMNIKSLAKWSWLTVLPAFFVVYSKKAGGYGQFLTDLESLTLDKIKTKTGNIVMAVAAGAVIYAITTLKAPPTIKVIVLGLAFFVLGYNILKIVDPPMAGMQGGYRAPTTSLYYGRST